MISPTFKFQTDGISELSKGLFCGSFKFFLSFLGCNCWCCTDLINRLNYLMLGFVQAYLEMEDVCSGLWFTVLV